MPEEQPLSDDAKATASASNGLDAFNQKIAANEQRIAELDRQERMGRYQLAKLVGSMADVAYTGSLEQLREEFRRRRLECLLGGSIATEPYLASLLARHRPFDDWGDNNAELAAQAVEAVRDEIDAIATEQELPPRLVLLLDALVDVVEFGSRPASS